MNAVEKCHSKKNAFKVTLDSIACLTPLYRKYYVSVNFTNFFIKFGFFRFFTVTQIFTLNTGALDNFKNNSLFSAN